MGFARLCINPVGAYDTKTDDTKKNVDCSNDGHCMISGDDTHLIGVQVTQLGVVRRTGRTLTLLVLLWELTLHLTPLVLQSRFGI